MKDLKTVLIICEELLNKGYVDAVKEILKETNHERTREISERLSVGRERE